MTPKFVSQKFARKWYDLGTQYTEYDTTRAAINAAIDDDHDIDCWEKAAAFRAGKNGFPFEIKAWKRYGNIPVGSDGYAERSRNHADGDPEYGVSAFDSDWFNSPTGQWAMSNMGGRKLVKFTGIQVGYGSDGEPVVLPIKKEDE